VLATKLGPEGPSASCLVGW